MVESSAMRSLGRDVIEQENTKLLRDNEGGIRQSVVPGRSGPDASPASLCGLFVEEIPVGRSLLLAPARTEMLACRLLSAPARIPGPAGGRSLDGFRAVPQTSRPTQECREGHAIAPAISI